MEPVVSRGNILVERHGRRMSAPTSRVALTIAAGALVALVVVLAASAIKPFVLGVLLVYLLAPVVERLARIGLPRWLAVLLVFAMVIAVVSVTLAVAMAPLITQVRQFIADLPDLAAELRRSFTQFYQGLHLAPVVRDAIDNTISRAGTGIGGIDVGGLASPLVTSIVGVLSTITAYAILPAWLFFVLKDRLRLADSLEASLPAGWRGDVFALFAIVDRVFGNWVRGLLVLGGSVAVLTFAGLTLLSFWVDPVFGKYAILLSIVAGLLELVPFIGPVIAAIPTVLIGLTAGPGGFLAALALWSVIQLLENNVLVPKIQGDAVELHPSAVLIALVVGAAIGGVLGAIVSLPIAAASRDMFRYAFHRVGEPPASVDESLARISPGLTVSVRRSAVDADVSTDVSSSERTPEMVPAASGGEPRVRDALP
jgi:predicted PurR-regulated permease PerM